MSAKFLLPLFLTLSLSSLAQTTISNQPWGPWESHPGYLHLRSRAKCSYTINADNTSVWDYQFRNDYTYPVDFIEKEEGFNKRIRANAMGAPGQFSLGAGEIGSAMSTTLKGSCQELGGLKVAVLCVVPKGDAEKCYDKLGLKGGTVNVHELATEPTSLPSRPQNTRQEGERANGSTMPSGKPKVDDPFQSVTSQCYLPPSNLDRSHDSLGNAIMSFIPGQQSGSNPVMLQWSSDPFTITTKPDQSLQFFGRTVPYTLKKYPDGEYERTWEIPANGVTLTFKERLPVKDDGTINLELNGASIEASPQPQYSYSHTMNCQHAPI